MSVTIQLRGGTAADWTLANPILASREIGIETDTDLYKIGNGIDSWNDLPYKPLRNIDSATIINFDNSATPAAPAPNTLNLFGKSLSGRMMLRQQGPSGLATPLQPSFFQNQIIMINTNATTSLGVFGNTVTSVGTISHPVITEQYGWMANFAGAGTAGITNGTGTNGVLFCRGSAPNTASGFFFNARVAYPDSSYDGTTGTTGSRTFLGLTNQTMANSVASDTPAGHYCGFFRRHIGSGAQDTNWQFATRNNISTTFTDTGLPFLPEKVYDVYTFCPPNGTTISWRIDNVTDGTTAEGSVIDTLPDASTFMRCGIQLQTANAVVRNIRMQRIYCESDR